MKRILGALYLSISICLLSYGAFLIHERTAPIPTEQNNSLAPFHDSVFQLKIPSSHIALPVYSASITGTSWQTTKRGVSYLSTSPLPGEQGNSVLYGHNWPNLLKPLHTVKPGDSIFITRSGRTTRFIVRYVTVVEANEHSIYAASTKTKLTIYTCTGFLDTKRLVVTAFPELL